MSSLLGQRMSIVGGGIAGLATALALARRGVVVEVYEQAEQISEIGAGIQISPNGSRVLAALDILDEMEANSVCAKSVTLNDHGGGRVARLALDGLGPFLMTHRADLIHMLRKAALLAGVEIHLGSRLDAITRSADGVGLRFVDGRTITTPLVIGADGGRSRCRAALHRDDAPPFSGQVAWRALIPLRAGEADTLPEGPQIFMGPGRHVVSYPLRDRKILNIVAVEEQAAWVAESWHHEGDRTRLKRAFSEFGPPVSDWLSRVERVMAWGLFNHPVAPQWHDEELVLVGDAAHPTLPFLAQGANLALEDAWTLAASLGERVDLVEGMALYQARRRERAVKVVKAATRNAQNYHLRGPARHVAHTVLRGMDRYAPDLLTRRFNWLYGHDVTDGVAGF